MEKISVVFNTFNEEKNLSRALASIRQLADEIVVCDMGSSDGTVKVAEEAEAKIFQHKRLLYVEPARNFAISKATNEWVLILDPDEEVSKSLAKKLKQITEQKMADFYRLPRKNIIFGKWIKHCRWWPDYNIRFFKKGHVVWNEIIHSVPMTQGKGMDLPEKEELAIIHHNYDSIEEYLSRMERYAEVQSKILIEHNYKFIWKDLIKHPLEEFLGRYFAGEGYKDGVHGLALSFLQAFSEAVVYLKVWQNEKFMEQAISTGELEKEFNTAIRDLNWWVSEISLKTKGFISSLPTRLFRKVTQKNV
jgi:(heptosyl)LPS beta-1,4-glucosyltransferase